MTDPRWPDSWAPYMTWSKHHDKAGCDLSGSNLLPCTLEEFPEARKPAYRMRIDFGAELGIKKSSAQITKYYRPDELVGRQVMAVVNFPPRQIGPIMSEVLTLGFPDDTGDVVLANVDRRVANGSRLF